MKKHLKNKKKPKEITPKNCWKENQEEELVKRERFGLFSVFNGILTFLGYLMPKLSL